MTRTRLLGSVCGAIGLLAMGAVSGLYVASYLSSSTMVLMEASIVAVGAVVTTLWTRTTRPPESVEQLLYEIEHPQRP